MQINITVLGIIVFVLVASLVISVSALVKKSIPGPVGPVGPKGDTGSAGLDSSFPLVNDNNKIYFDKNNPIFYGIDSDSTLVVPKICIGSTDTCINSADQLQKIIKLVS